MSSHKPKPVLKSVQQKTTAVKKSALESISPATVLQLQDWTRRAHAVNFKREEAENELLGKGWKQDVVSELLDDVYGKK